jgi:geranylgeranylglycerol-phosphate geranylgeranyltransferase
VRATVRLVRPGNVAVSFVGTVVGGLVAGGHGVALPGETWLYVTLLAFSTALVTAGGNVLNDLEDRESDRANHPDRPLVTGEVSVRAARSIAIGGFVVGSALAVPVAFHAPLVAVILVAAVGLLLGYELRWKRRGFVGNAVVAALTGLVFLYGGAGVGAPELLLPFAAMAFLATLSREVIKDMEDMEGDVDRTTLPRTYGLRLSSGVARAAIVGAIVLSAVPLLWFVRAGTWAGDLYLAFVAVADAVFVGSIALLPRQLRLEQQTSKAAMTVALVAFVVVAFR